LEDIGRKLKWTWPNQKRHTLEAFLREETLSILPAPGRRFVREEDGGPDQYADRGLLDFCCGTLMGKNIQHNASRGNECTHKIKCFARNL
jgi:hypothetical protein